MKSNGMDNEGDARKKKKKKDCLFEIRNVTAQALRR